MKIRGKFKLWAITNWGYPGKSYQFNADTTHDDSIPDDQQFSKYTPSGQLTISIENPIVNEHLDKSIGKSFYLDLTDIS